MVNERRFGVPKTEEERLETHRAEYGEEALPPRGTRQRYRWGAEDFYDLASRELDKSFRADDEKNMAASTGTNDLEFEQVKAGRVLIVEALSGYNDTSGCTRIRLGYKLLGTIHTLRCVPAPLTTETVALLREVRLREGMMPIVRFEGCTSGDDLYATLNGYWIKV